MSLNIWMFLHLCVAELEYNPTSTLFINVPTISKLQWHPFTVTSNCNMEPDKLSIVIKSGGSWSQKLYKQLSSVEHLAVSVEGPYGPSSFSFLRLLFFIHKLWLWHKNLDRLDSDIYIFTCICVQAWGSDYGVWWKWDYSFHLYNPRDHVPKCQA